MAESDPFDFQNQVDEADWSLLAPHHTRGALFIVDRELDLVEVATAIAQDDLNRVQIWLGNSQLRRPSEEEEKSWSEDQHRKMAQFLIVQPYVIIQLNRS